MNRRNVFALTISALAAMAAAGSMRVSDPALPAERALPSPVPSMRRSRFAPNPPGWGRRSSSAYGRGWWLNTTRERTRRVRQMARAAAKLASL